MDVHPNGPILLVGEGDFSFSVAMTMKLPALYHSHILATSLETCESIQKHVTADENITTLKERGVEVRLSTDATQLHTNPYLKDKRFSRIIFNFPHTGGKSNLKRNRKLLLDFFSSASHILESQGHIMVTLCKGQGGTPADQPMRKWHDTWQVVSMAASAGFILVKTLPFDQEEYTVYTSTGFRSQDKRFHTERAVTHVFERADCVPIPASTEDVKICVNGQQFQCPIYLYDKLNHIRWINGQSYHLAHHVYRNIMQQFRIKMRNQQGSHVNDRGYQKCLLIQSPCFWDRTDVCTNGLETTRNSCTLSMCNETSEVCDKDFDDVIVEMSKQTTDKTDVNHNKYHLARSLIDCVDNMSDMVLEDGWSTCYGVVFQNVPISSSKIPPSFSLLVTCPLSHDSGQKSGDSSTLLDATSSKSSDQAYQSFDQISTEDMVHYSQPEIKGILEMIEAVFAVPNMNLELGTKHQLEREFKYGRLCTVGNITLRNILQEEPDVTEIGQACIVELNPNTSKQSQKIMIELNLSRLICSKYRIPSEKFLWSSDYRVMREFERINLLHENILVRETEIAQEDVTREKYELRKENQSCAENEMKDGRNTCTGIPNTNVNEEITENSGTCLEVVKDISDRSESVASKGITQTDAAVKDKISISEDMNMLDLSNSTREVFIPPSLYPLRSIHDMSFWENENIPFNENIYHDIIRSIAGDEVSSVELIDVFMDPTSGKSSRCYRLTFMSMDKCLSYDCSWKLQSLIRLEVERLMKIILR